MEGSDRQTPLWLLPASSVELPSLRKRHVVGTYVLVCVALAALVPAFLVAPNSTWLPHDTFTILFAAGFVCAAAGARVRTVVLADSATVPVLLGVTLFGPLPGACIFAAGEAIYLFREPSPRQPLSVLTNLVMCGWTCLAAGIFMDAVGFPAPVTQSEPLLYLAVFVAGLVIVAIDTLMLSTVSVMYDDVDAQVLLRGILKTVIIPDVAMGAIAAAVLWTYFEFGIAGLVVPLVAVALLPRAVVHLFDRQPIDAMEVPDATSHYATLLGGALGVSRHDRRVLTDAGAQMGGRPVLNRPDDFQDVMQAVLYAGERWDGEPGGFPGTLSGEDIPLNSRVLAVAHLWASLTAKGTRQMQPRDALVELRARAGAELDPTVVAAAFKVVEDEFLPAPSGEPIAAGASR